MARETYVFRDGQLIPKHQAAPLHRKFGRGPYIRTDGMDPVRSMVDGSIYDSKSAYYDSVRRAGCEIVGDDKAAFETKPEYQPVTTGKDIKQAIEQLEGQQ